MSEGIQSPVQNSRPRRGASEPSSGDPRTTEPLPHIGAEAGAQIPTGAGTSELAQARSSASEACCRGILRRRWCCASVPLVWCRNTLITCSGIWVRNPGGHERNTGTWALAGGRGPHHEPRSARTSIAFFTGPGVSGERRQDVRAPRAHRRSWRAGTTSASSLSGPNEPKKPAKSESKLSST